jgi:hypothetical protein
MIDALIKRVSVTYNCYEMYAHRGEKVQLLENYHRFIISLQANNLTSLSPYATDLTSDRLKRIICILSLINCKLAWFFVRN